MSTTPNHFALIRKLIAAPPGDYIGDDGETRGATRTDIVAKPAKFNDGLPPIPDPEDPTVRMAPERVMDLLRNNEPAPETSDSNVGQSATRILEPDEVERAQKAPTTDPRAVKQPFAIVENIPVRRPPLTSEFAPTAAAEQQRPSARPRYAAVARHSRVARVASLGLLGLVVFSTAFVGTRAIQDPRSRALTGDLVTDWYAGAAARARSWFGPDGSEALAGPVAARPKAAAPTAPARKIESAPHGNAKPSPSAQAVAPEGNPPVVQIEDLKPLSECEGSDCEAESESVAKPPTSERRPAKGNAPR